MCPKYGALASMFLFPPFTCAAYPRKILINVAFQDTHMHEIRLAPIVHKCAFPRTIFFFFCPFHFVLQTPSEVRPRSQAVGVADVFNGTWFVSWWRDKHGEEIKTPGFLPQSLVFILLRLRMAMPGLHSGL